MHKNDFETNLLRSHINRKLQKFSDSLLDLEILTKYLKQLKEHNIEQNKQQEREKQLSFHFSLTYNEMGKMVFQKGDYQEAASLFMEAEKFNPNNVGMLCNLGDCLIVYYRSNLETERYSWCGRELSEGRDNN